MRSGDEHKLTATISVQENPADVKALCGTLEDAMIGNITEWCTDVSNEETALTAYVSTCKAIGVTISMFIPTTLTKEEIERLQELD